MTQTGAMLRPGSANPALAAVVLTATLLAGCTGGSADTTPTPTHVPTGSSATRTSSTPSPTTSACPVVRHTVATDLNVPWGIAVLPYGSALVSLREQARIVRMTPSGEVTRVPTNRADRRVEGVVPDGEGGLLGVARLADVRDRPAGLRLLHRVGRQPDRPDDLRAGGAAPDRRSSPGSRRPVTTTAGGSPSARTGCCTSRPATPADRGAAQDRRSLGGKILRITPAARPRRATRSATRGLTARPPQPAGPGLGRRRAASGPPSSARTPATSST